MLNQQVKNNDYLQILYISGYEVWKEYVSNQVTIN